MRTKNKIKNDPIMIFWKKYRKKHVITLHWKYNNSDRFTLHVDFDFKNLPVSIGNLLLVHRNLAQTIIY
jgi:hypothetical protein